LPEYRLHGEEGADHAKKFFVRCRLTDQAREVEGSGSSRRKAEQAAARVMLETLEGSAT
jgi:ribonuclease-3